MMGGAQRTKSGHGSRSHCKQQPEQQQSLRIEDANNVATTEDANKCDNEVRELQRASKVSLSLKRSTDDLERLFIFGITM